jgi:membrane-bound inhibitor of C-type lysozyme
MQASRAPRPQAPLWILLPTLAAACGPAADAPPAAEPAAGWSYAAEGSGAAVWSSGGGETLAVACGEPGASLRVTRGGLDRPRAGVLRLEAAGAGVDIPAAPAGDNALAGSLPLTDPFLGALARATGPLSVAAGGETVSTAPLTASLRRVVRDCRAGGAGATADPAAPITYECLDGNTVTAAYPDETSVVVTQAGQSYRMTAVPAERGTRYAGEGRQWWLQGRGRFASGFLGELKPGETQASDPGLLCKQKNPNAG